MAINDIYELTFNTTLLGQNCANVFHYRQTGGGAGDGAMNLNNGWRDTLDALFREVCSLQVDFVSLSTRNLFDPTDFDVELVLTGGNVIGEVFSPFAAWGFTKVTTNLSVRSGGFRVPGVVETFVNDGVAVGAIVPSLDALATGMGLDIVEGGDTFELGMWSLANTKHVDNIFVPTPTVVYSRLTTQNSRKF